MEDCAKTAEFRIRILAEIPRRIPCLFDRCIWHLGISGAKQKGTAHNPGSGSIAWFYSMNQIYLNLFVQFKDVGLVDTQVLENAVMISNPTMRRIIPWTSGHRTVEIRVDLLPPSVTDLLFVLRWQREIVAAYKYTADGNSWTWSKASSRDAEFKSNQKDDSPFQVPSTGIVLRCANQVISATNSRDLSKFTALRHLARERQFKSCFILSGTPEL